MEQGERALALCRSFVLFVREKRKEGGEEGGGELRTVDRMAPLKICCGRRSLVRAATATTTSATVQNKTNASVPSQLAVSAAPPPGRTASPSRRLRRRESGGGFLQCRVSGGKKDESGLRFFFICSRNLHARLVSSFARLLCARPSDKCRDNIVL